MFGGWGLLPSLGIAAAWLLPRLGPDSADAAPVPSVATVPCTKRNALQVGRECHVSAQQGNRGTRPWDSSPLATCPAQGTVVQVPVSQSKQGELPQTTVPSFRAMGFGAVHLPFFMGSLTSLCLLL